MKKESVVLNGQPVGRLKAGWLLFKEVWRYFRADTEMMWIPLITTLLNLLLFGLLVFVWYVFSTSTGSTSLNELGAYSAMNYAFIFLCYVVGAFSLALAEAGVTNTVYTRAHGGDATLGNSIQAAFSHWLPLLVWSGITSTVGLILRMIAERSRIMGSIVVALLGTSWSVLTYFVVPAMVIDKKSALASIQKSGHVFKTTWGESLVSNISLGVIFLVIHFALLCAASGLLFFTIYHELWTAFFTLTIVYLLITVALFLVQSAMNGILKTLLYIYASENTVPTNFNKELLEKMLARRTTPTSLPHTQGTTQSTV